MELNAIKLDPTKLERGVWWHIRGESGAIAGVAVDKLEVDQPAVLVVPFGIMYERAVEELREPYAGRELSDDDRRKILGQALGRTTFRGCQNLTMGGKPVVWSEELAIQLMTDPAWSALCDFVVHAASNRAAALAKQEEVDQGN